MKFKTTNIKFFYLDIFENYSAKFIIFIYKKTIYCKIFIFIDRIKNYIYIVDKVAICKNLFFCF